MCVFIVFLVGYAMAGQAEPPPALGTLRLVHALQGEEALQVINRLHGKEVAGEESYIAHYEKEGAVAMLYVSQASSAEQATRQVENMAERIKQGNTPFYHLKVLQREGTPVYSALGQGQIHYFYRREATVIWLAVDPRVAQEALTQLFHQMR
ncbi:MAG: hypothetical protein D6736_11470 [Nitrospinota bacterium]|nr:MAG: hypothetical protein D6736_11470 [Nitrospinota bacterium]